MMKILVVEDDVTVAETLGDLLSNHQYAVDLAADGNVGLQMANAFSYDLVLLDVGLPQLDGLSLCRQLRTQGYQMPILLLTGQDESSQKALALKSGADDYVVKPFDIDELIARVQALLRRGELKTQPILSWGKLSIDPGSFRVTYGPHLLPTTPKEYAILELFLRNPQTVFSARAILDKAWTSLNSTGEEAIRVHIKDLRKKLRDIGAPKDWIKTVYGRGYQLNPLYGTPRASGSDSSLTPPEMAELRQLQQRDRQWQALFDQALDAIAIADDHGWYVDANPAACELFGVPKEQLLQCNVADFASSAFDFVQVWQEFLRDGQLSGEFCVHRPDGTTRETEFSAIANFVPGRHLSILRDISERKRSEAEREQAESERKVSEAQLQRLASNVAVMIYQYVLRADGSDAFTYVSPRCRDIYELEPEVVLRDVGRVWTMIHPDDVERVRHVNLTSAQQLTSFDVEFRLLPPSGCIRWVRAVSQPERQANGDIVWDGFVLDISDRKQVEMTLKNELLRNKALFDVSIDGIVVVDDCGDVVQTSPSFANMLGYTIEETLALNISDWDAQWSREELLKVTKSDVVLPPYFETRHRRKDGSIYDVEISYNQLVLDGTLVHFCVCRDITDRKQAELAVRESEARWQFALEGAGDGVWDWNAETNTVFFSHQWKAMLGYADHEISNTLYEWDSRVHPDDKAQCYADLNKHFRGETPIYQNEHRVRCKDGSYKWILDRGKVIEWKAAGQPLRVIGTHTDITERKQSEQAASLLAAVVESSDDAIISKNLDGIITSWNAGATKLFGYSEAEAIGHPISILFPPDRMDEEVHILRRLRNGERVDHFETVRLRNDGTPLTVSITISPLKDDRGQVFGASKIVRNITAQKRAERKIREQAALLDIASDAIFVRDLDHRILYWNRGAERLYGWQAAEAVGQVAHELLQNDTSQVPAIMKTLLSQGEWQGELCKKTKSGQDVIVEGRWTLVRNEAGQPKFILSVDTDITEKKHLEAQFYQAQRLESLGRLASGIAHDLNNVLTPILTIAQLLRLTEKDLDDHARNRLKILEDSAKRGADMVRQILTFTRGSTGERKPVSLISVLREVVDMTRQSFPKSIRIRCDVPGSGPFPDVVSANPTHLHQVFMNLCLNARDAMPDGGILTLSVTHCFIDESMARMNLDANVGPYLVVTIIDTGIGITYDVRDRIFEPFFTTKGIGQGTGLGLSTALGIVKDYGGFMQVSSDIGLGTQVKVYLPMAQDSMEKRHQPEEPLNGKGELVFIVDDDVAVQQTTQYVFESHHYRVLTANDGEEAIALYAQHQNEISLFILDVMMPNMDGILLVERLRSLNSDIKIIALSGLSTNRDPILAAGANLFLTKPYSIQSLLKNAQDLVQGAKI